MRKPRLPMLSTREVAIKYKLRACFNLSSKLDLWQPKEISEFQIAIGAALLIIDTHLAELRAKSTLKTIDQQALEEKWLYLFYIELSNFGIAHDVSHHLYEVLRQYGELVGTPEQAARYAANRWVECTDWAKRTKGKRK